MEILEDQEVPTPIKSTTTSSTVPIVTPTMTSTTIDATINSISPITEPTSYLTTIKRSSIGIMSSQLFHELE